MRDNRLNNELVKSFREQAPSEIFKRRLTLARLKASNAKNRLSKNIKRVSGKFLRGRLKNNAITKSSNVKINVGQLLKERNAQYESKFINDEMIKEKRLFLK